MSAFFRLVQGNEAATNSVEVWISIPTTSISDLAMIATPPWVSFSRSFLATNLNSGGRISLSVMLTMLIGVISRYYDLATLKNEYVRVLASMDVPMGRPDSSVGRLALTSWISLPRRFESR